MTTDDSNDSSRPPKPRNDVPRDEESNPFINFRRYADEQASSLFGLLGTLRKEFLEESRRYTETMREEGDRYCPVLRRRRRKREEDGEEYGEEYGEEKTKTSESLWPAFSEENLQVKQILEELDAMFQNNDNRQREMRRFSKEWDRGLSVDNPLPQMGFFFFSRYSPIQLEKNSVHPFPWRDAFEDLLHADRGVGLPQRSDLGLHNQEGPLQWLHGLWNRTNHDDLLPFAKFDAQRRQSLDPLFPFRENRTWLLNSKFGDMYFRRPYCDDGFWGQTQRAGATERIFGALFGSLVPPQLEFQERDGNSPFDDEDDFEDDEEDGDDIEDDDDDDQGTPSTEQELYERFFGIPRDAPSTASANAHSPHTSVHKPSASKPSVLSTLTTTERTIQPDGTVITKVVLKKRFVDGKEEMSESIHHAHNARETEISSAQTETKEKKGGWFWSS